MEFSERLNALIIRIGCSASQLASASGVSDAMISRYRSGERVPEKKSVQLEKLVEGLSSLASQKNIQDLTPEIIRNALSECIHEALAVDSDLLVSSEQSYHSHEHQRDRNGKNIELRCFLSFSSSLGAEKTS